MKTVELVDVLEVVVLVVVQVVVALGAHSVQGRMLHIINCITNLLNYVAIYWSSQLQTGLGYSSSQSVPSRSLAHLLASNRSIP
jgi:hypothetical protein